MFLLAFCVCLSVCLSVTTRSSIKTAKLIITQTTNLVTPNHPYFYILGLPKFLHTSGMAETRVFVFKFCKVTPVLALGRQIWDYG